MSPLIKGTSRKAFVANVKKTQREGVRGKKAPIKQSVAIAYSMARRSGGKK